MKITEKFVLPSSSNAQIGFGSPENQFWKCVLNKPSISAMEEK